MHTLGLSSRRTSCLDAASFTDFSGTALSRSMSNCRRHYGIDINSYLGVEFPEDRIKLPASTSSFINYDTITS